MPVLRFGAAWRHAMLVVQQEHLLSCSGSVRRAVAGDAMALGGVLVFATARQRRSGSPSSRSMQAGGFQRESGVESVQRPRAELMRDALVLRYRQPRGRTGSSAEERAAGGLV